MWRAKESVSIEKLANGKYVFEIQPCNRTYLDHNYFPVCNDGC